jgi:C1A family cysteine protease/predicted secreted protein
MKDRCKEQRVGAFAIGFWLVAQAGCAAQEPAAATSFRVARLEDSGGRASLSQEDLLAVELEARPSAGYTWNVAALDTNVLTLAGREHVSAEVLGGVDLERLLFKGVSAGTTSLTLVYNRPWEEPDPGDATYTLVVDVQGPYTGSYTEPLPEVATRSALLGDDAGADGTMPSRFNLCDPGDGSYSKCTPIKNQGSCGGCWAFATAGVFENLLYFADPSVAPDLSEQYLISCNKEGYSCAMGGLASFGYYVNKYKSPPETAAGAVYEADFPFKGKDGSCGSSAHTHHETLTGFSRIARGLATVSDIKKALMTSGPVWTSVCADDAFSNYRYTGQSSIYRGKCSSINHAVIIVGWDDNNGDGYWFLRNSWGARWGDKGYMRIAYGASKVGTDSYTASYKAAASVANVPPIADAGDPQTVKSGAVATLDGSASLDPDGSISRYAWAQSGGSPAVKLNSTSAVKPTFTAPSLDSTAELTFTLTVTDNAGATATSSVVITVTGKNIPPVADAGRAQTVEEGTQVTLDGSGSSDSDGSLASYSWSQVTGSAQVPSVSLAGASTSKATFVAPSVPAESERVALTFALTVTDDAGATARGTVVITVVRANLPPVARAGPTQRVNKGASVTLDGSASSDSDGDIVSYSWAQVGGPAVSLKGTDSAKPTFAAPSGDATLTFQLTVTDDAGATASASVVVAVGLASATPSSGPDSGTGAAFDSSTVVGSCSSSGLSGIELWALPFAWSILRRRRRP